MSRRLSLFPSKSDESVTEGTEVQDTPEDTHEGIENEVFDPEEAENQITDFMTQRMSVVSFGKTAHKSSRTSPEESKIKNIETTETKPDQTSRMTRSATKVRIDSHDSSCQECNAGFVCPGCTHPHNMTKDIEQILADMNKNSKDDGSKI